MQRDLPVDDDDRNKLAIISMQTTHDLHVFVGQLKIEYLQIKKLSGIRNAIASKSILQFVAVLSFAIPLVSKFGFLKSLKIYFILSLDGIVIQWKWNGVSPLSFAHTPMFPRFFQEFSMEFLHLFVKINKHSCTPLFYNLSPDYNFNYNWMIIKLIFLQ